MIRARDRRAQRLLQESGRGGDGVRGRLERNPATDAGVDSPALDLLRVFGVLGVLRLGGMETVRTNNGRESDMLQHAKQMQSS